MALQSPNPRILRDSRGAIMVLGIFFACVMIGWMWMLVGLGDAMIWRDRSQEAADAITYSSAAIQAKGMNLISFLNDVMLVITFIYLVMAIVYNMLDFAHVILGSTDDGGCIGKSSAKARHGHCQLAAAAADVVPGLEWLGAILQPICNSWEKVAGVVEKAHAKVGDVLGPYETKVMAKFLPLLSKGEDVCGYGAPWAGEALGIYMGTKYVDYGKTRYGMPLSATLLPGSLTPATIKWNTETCETADDAEGGKCKQITGTKDNRQGLPVEIPEDGMSRLCNVAARTGLSGIQSAIGGGFLGTIAGYLFTGFAGMVEDDWCKQKSQGILDGVDSDAAYGLQVLTALTFDAGNDNNEKCPNDNWGQNNGGGGAGEFGCGGPGTCNGVYAIQTSAKKQLWENPDEVGGPHVVVEYASNGSDWMQTWSFVYGGNRSDIEQAEKKVAVAGMDSNDPTGNTTSPWQSVIPQDSEQVVGAGFPMYVAQSEFYYDCTETWHKDDCDADYNKSSFEMRWRARLRRVRGLSWKNDLFTYFTGGSLGDNFNDYATKWLNGLGGKAETSTVTKMFAGFVGQSLLKGAFGEIKDKTFENVGGMINPANVIPDVIH